MIFAFANPRLKENKEGKGGLSAPGSPGGKLLSWDYLRHGGRRRVSGNWINVLGSVCVLVKDS